MKKWTKEDLEKAGYMIENAKITKVNLSMADYCSMTLEMTLEGGGWGVVYGGYVLGKGDLWCKDEDIEGSAAGMEYLIHVMRIVGASRFKDMEGKYIRVASTGWGDTIKIIGNIINDKWFDPVSFFEDKKEKEDANKGDE